MWEIALTLASFVGAACCHHDSAALALGALWWSQDSDVPAAARDRAPSPNAETATFAAGCFWCVEAVFQEIDGVDSVVSGYTGGATENPTDRDVCGGGTGHAEACRIVFDPTKVTYEELLDVFFAVHDPTTPNRQGADVGTQYRSAIFYHSETQKRAAESKKASLGANVVTEIASAGAFYEAEEYHQNYFLENPRQPYCIAVVRPKVEKARERFADKLRPTDP